MARRPTYGERMLDWEREKDQRDWSNSFLNAVSAKDYTRVEELVKEGLEDAYEFPRVDDPRVIEIIQKLS